MAKDKKKKAAEKPKKKGSTKTLLMIIIISMMTIAIFKTGFIFMVIGLLPSIVAYYLDVTRSRTTFHTVLACNLSGVLPYMARILQESSTSGSYVTSLMGDAQTWLVVYASAGFGWLLVFATPLFAQLIISMFNRGQIARFESMQDRIVKDWGPEVANMFPTNNNNDD